MEMTIVVEVEVRNYKILIFIKAIVYPGTCLQAE